GGPGLALVPRDCGFIVRLVDEVGGDLADFRIAAAGDGQRQGGGRDRRPLRKGRLSVEFQQRSTCVRRIVAGPRLEDRIAAVVRRCVAATAKRRGICIGEGQRLGADGGRAGGEQNSAESQRASDGDRIR